MTVFNYAVTTLVARATKLSAVALALALVACSKPPKTTVDVDTMREASFVNDVKEEPPSRKREDPSEAEAPVPAAGSAAPPATKDGLPEPEILSRKLDRGDAKDKDKDQDRKPVKKPAGREKISAAECARMFDRFFDLVLESDDRFKDLGADGKNMVRQISAQDQRFQGMQKDCETDVSRTKWNCAMGARTQAAWQACVK